MSVTIKLLSASDLGFKAAFAYPKHQCAKIDLVETRLLGDRLIGQYCVAKALDLLA